MRLVLDTNVLISAFLSRGVCHDLLERCERDHEIVGSLFILSEFEEKLIEKFKLPLSDVRAARSLLEQHMTLVVPIEFDDRISPDADDDVVLGTAVAGRCECVVSGDSDLRDLKQFHGIRIVSPSEFWSYESAEDAR